MFILKSLLILLLALFVLTLCVGYSVMRRPPRPLPARTWWFWLLLFALAPLAMLSPIAHFLRWVAEGLTDLIDKAGDWLIEKIVPSFDP